MPALGCHGFTPREREREREREKERGEREGGGGRGRAVANFVPNGEGCERDEALKPPFLLGSNHVAKDRIVRVEPAGDQGKRVSGFR